MIEIRQYLPGDKNAVWTLHNEALAETGAQPGNGPWDDDLHDIDGHYLSPGGSFLVGLVDGKIVAMGALKRIDEAAGEIKRMRVAPRHQRRGYGEAVLLALENLAQRLGLSQLKLETTDVQLAAQQLYKKNGYRETGRGRMNKFNVVYFEKSLAPHEG